MQLGVLAIANALAKTLEREGRISWYSFCKQLADYYSHVFSLTTHCQWVLLQGNKTWVQSKISSCCLCLWCNSRELIDRGSPRFTTPIVESSSTDLLPPIKSYWVYSHLEFTLWLNPRAQREHLTSLVSCISCLSQAFGLVYLVDKLSWVFHKVIGQSRIWNSVKHQWQQSYVSGVCGVPLDDWANGGYVYGLLLGVMSWCWCKFFEKLVLFQRMCMEFRDKTMLQCPREVKCHTDCSWLNPGAHQHHLTSQLSWVAAWPALSSK